MTVKKYTKKEKTAALKRLKAGESVAAVARDMNIPRTTLIGWRKNSEATGARARKKTTRAREKSSTASTGGQKEEPALEPKENAETESAKQREEKKKTFSEESWGNIEKAQKLIERRLNRALNQEDALDELVDAVLETNDKDLTYQEKQSLLHKLRKIKVEDVRELVVLIGTLYDKQALANKEATNVLEGGLVVEFGIPRPPKKDKHES